jgi:hypothetical protein
MIDEPNDNDNDSNNNNNNNNSIQQFPFVAIPPSVIKQHQKEYKQMLSHIHRPSTTNITSIYI